MFLNLVSRQDFLIRDKKSVYLCSSAPVSNLVSSSTDILDKFVIFIDLFKSLSVVNDN